MKIRPLSSIPANNPLLWACAGSIVSLMLCFAPVSARGTSGYVSTQFAPGDFKLVQGDSIADIFVGPEENVAVVRCANDLAADIQRVTGKLPSVKRSTTGLSANAVLVGTVDTSTVLKTLVTAGKIDVSQIKGKWETFIVQVVANPLTGVGNALVIAGSDRRGAIYGMYDVSEKSGVSPWYWFADVPIQPQTSLIVKNGRYQEGPPSVKFRGIFINDEMWGLRPWAQKTYDPANPTGIGPKTYRKIFEMMARIRANYIWPAMHSGTLAFNRYDSNKIVADEYAIVMGASHIEPMLRNNMGGGGSEWDAETMGEWNYLTNKAAIYKYWEDRAKANGKYDNVWTLGKRGQDDQDMPEGTTLAEKKTVLEQIFEDQRTILTTWVNPDITKVPQVLIPYSEVLDIYNSGLKVPEDVMICWPDDSHGYIRRLSNTSEQKRSGGTGVYYHYQWLDGAADAWPWIFSMPLGLIWAEMHKAYEYNARDMWIVNVGDIKPYEIATEYFMKLGWNINAWTSQNSRQFLIQMATRDFGEQYASAIADIMEKNGQLGYQRKPEHMVSDIINPKGFIRFHHYNYNDESQARADAYDALAAKTIALYNQLPTELKDPFFEMISYNVLCASYHNQKVIYGGKSYAYGLEKRASANEYGVKANNALTLLNNVIEHYNTGLVLAKSKWNYMASFPGPWGGQWDEQKMPPLSKYSGSGPATLNLALEGGGSATRLPDLSVYTKNKRFIDLFNSGTGTITWSSSVSDNCIQLSDTAGTLTQEKRIWVTIDWTAAPTGENQSGTITLTGAGKTFTITVPIFNPATPLPADVTGFAESHGYICMEAEHYSKKNDKALAAWSIVSSCGWNNYAVTTLPALVARQTTAANILANSPSLEYTFYAFSTGAVTLTAYMAPTMAINSEHGSLYPRYAVAIDNGTPVVVDPPWGSTDYPPHVRKVTTPLNIASRGQHVLKVWMVDPGMLLDKLVLSTSPLLTSYLGPPESYFNQADPTVSMQR